MQQADSVSFARVLARREVLALSFGAMIGFSWVILTDNWILEAGAGGAALAFALGGIAILFIGLTYSELAAAMPLVGGEHVYSYRAMGDLGSFICTWAILLGYVSVAAFEAVAFPTILESLLGQNRIIFLWTVSGWDVYLSWALAGAAGSIVIAWINIRGVMVAAQVQTAVTIVIILAGLVLFSGASLNGEPANIRPLFNNGFTGFAGVLVLVPILFVGFDVIPQAAEEIDLPRITIGRLLTFSVILAVLFYIFIILSVGLCLNPAQLAAANVGTAEAAAIAVRGDWGSYLLLLAGLAGILTSWNAFVVGGSRAMYALAHANMLPRFFAVLHPVYKTPVNAICLITLLCVIAPFFGRPILMWLLNAGSFGIIIAYTLVAVSWLLLRRREPGMERPFRAGRSSITGWLALILALALTTLYLPGMPAALLWPHEWIIILAWIIAGGLMYSSVRYSYGPADPARILRQT